jgi:pyruvate formate lyase activating enzyme
MKQMNKNKKSNLLKPAGFIDQIPGNFFQEFEINRRSFLKSSAILSLACSYSNILFNHPLFAQPFPEPEKKFIQEARYYEKLSHKKIRCLLCPRQCVIDDRERGYCGVRENREGTYYTLVYARPCTYHTDPIEKKPLFHFHPGTTAFSIATAGCNVNCKMCQNWEISQVRPEQVRSIFMPPQEVVRIAKKYDCLSIAYTYSEPVIFYEYMEDTIVAGHKENIKSVVITGGYIEQKPLMNLCKLADAIKVDLKAYSEKYYQEIVNGELKPVLDGLITMINLGVWTEIVYLVVPGLNDSDQELKGLARWINHYLGKDVPVHFTKFYPQYLLKNLPPTPLQTLEKAKAIADAEGLQYVYIGNVPGHPAENTYCPKCKNMIVERTGYMIKNIKIKNSRCIHCKTKIAGIWGV